jgi:hypothetical protein
MRNAARARRDASATPWIVGDRHLSQEARRTRVNVALRTRRRLYRFCEDRDRSAQRGVTSTVASREVWSAYGRAMRPPDLIRPPSNSRRQKRVYRRRRLTATPASNRAEQSPSTVLGPTHPLTRATEALAGVTRQWRTCAALLAGAIIAQLEGHTWATGLAISTGAVLLTLTALAAALLLRVRDGARDLIAEGRETLPIIAVQRERRRLLARHRRKVLARTLDAMVRQATSPPTIPSARPLFDIRVVAGVSGDLRAVISLLQKKHARARGVALTERLIVDGGSPLYGQDQTRLREELHRVRGLLEE